MKHYMVKQVYLIWGSSIKFQSALYPPLGLSYIAATLKENMIDFEVIDLLFDPDFNEIKSIRTKNNIYCISFTSAGYELTKEVTGIIRVNDPESTIIVGGAHSTLFTEETIRAGVADIAVKGEGELIVLELIKCLQDNKPIDKIQSICYMKDGQIYTNPRTSFITDLDSLPFAAQAEFPIEKYFKIKGFRELSIITSRGCPFNCTFCQPTLNSLFGKKVRFRSACNVVDEIEWMVKELKLDFFVISDDTFSADKVRLKKICEEIISRKIHILWRCQARVPLDSKILRIMKKAGCFLIGFGVESGSQSVLDKMCKGITVQQVIDTFKNCRETGVIAYPFLMLGSVGETKGTIQETINLIRKIKPYSMSVSICVPLPKTYLHDYAKQHGMLEEGDVFHYHSFEDAKGLILPNLSKDEIIQGKIDMETALKENADKIGNLLRLVDLDFLIRLFNIIIHNPTFVYRTVKLVIKTITTIETPKVVNPEIKYD